jgi:hypothetical protein
MTKWILMTFGLFLAIVAGPAFAQDVGLCFSTAERVLNGEQIADQEKRAAHEACASALAATGSIVQKYQLQEADFAIMGARPKQDGGR